MTFFTTGVNLFPPMHGGYMVSQTRTTDRGLGSEHSPEDQGTDHRRIRARTKSNIFEPLVRLRRHDAQIDQEMVCAEYADDGDHAD